MKKQKNKALNLKVKIISGIWRGRNINFLSKERSKAYKKYNKRNSF